MKLRRLWMMTAMMAATFFVVPPGSSAQNHRASLELDLLRMSDGRGRISRDAHDGRVRFFGADRKGAVPPEGKARPSSAVEAGEGFLSRYGRLFGLREPSRELRADQVRKTRDDRSIIRYQQHHEGVPVVGGELIVQTTGPDNRVLLAGGKIAADLGLNVVPRITPFDAQATALAGVAKHHGMEEDRFSVTEPELWVYDPKVLGGPGGTPCLVWKMEVLPRETLPIREWVLVDALRGGLALHFNQSTLALSRRVYDARGLETLPGELVRSESQPATGDGDADDAYRFMGSTYDFYFDQHHRDSINNAGMILQATVNYGVGYANAFWDGTRMVFGQGFVADDVVAHELTHGVTEHESRLFYYYQSGAINEALSDIWGEFVDLTNGAGNDSDAARWLVGEDLPMGPIRNMRSPSQFGQPERMGDSSSYYCGTGDNGGVHVNSSIAAKVAVLLTDGGAFNGYSIQKLSGGIPMVAGLFYEVQANLLTSASDYQDLANALIQAADNLGLGVSDRQAVLNAVDAVEMGLQPAGCPSTDAPDPICSAGDTKVLFDDNLENPAAGNWRASSSQAPWYYPPRDNPYAFDATYATSGIHNLWGDNVDRVGDYSMAMSRSVVLPTRGSFYLQFNHAYGFEASSTPGVGFDGGVVEYSVDGGIKWADAGPFFTHNGYTRTLSSGYDNPLKGRMAFSGSSRGYISSRLDVSSLAGQSVRFRFRIGTDSYVGDWGWFIDDIRIFACGSEGPSGQISITAPAGGGAWMAGKRQTLSWTGAPEFGRTVRIELWKGNSLARLIRRVARVRADGSGSIVWVIPRRQQPGDDYGIRITGRTGGVGVSEAPFSIVPYSR